MSGMKESDGQRRLERVYHGTWEAEAILRDGFLDVEMLDAWDRPVSGVFVTSSYDVARGYGPDVIEIELVPEIAAQIASDIELWDETLLPAADLNQCLMYRTGGGAR